MAKAKFSVEQTAGAETEDEKKPFEMESEEGDQVHMGDQSSVKISTVADGSVMMHIEGLSIKDEGSEPEANPEPMDVHLSTGETVEFSEGNKSWKVTLVSTEG